MICGKVRCRNLVYVDTLSQNTNWLVLTLWLEEEGMETHFNILARKTPWAGVLVGYSPWSLRSPTRLEWASTNWFLSVEVFKVLEVLWFNVCFSVIFISYDTESRILYMRKRIKLSLGNGHFKMVKLKSSRWRNNSTSTFIYLKYSLNFIMYYSLGTDVFIPEKRPILCAVNILGKNLYICNTPSQLRWNQWCWLTKLLISIKYDSWHLK